MSSDVSWPMSRSDKEVNAGHHWRTQTSTLLGSSHHMITMITRTRAGGKDLSFLRVCMMENCVSPLWVLVLLTVFWAAGCNNYTLKVLVIDW